MPDNKKKLYETLAKKKLYTKSFEEFSEQFSTPEKINKLYTTLYNKGLYTKSIKDFTHQFFPELNIENTLRSIYNDLGLEKAGITFEEFSAKMKSNPEVRQIVYKDLRLEKAGITYDKFESSLGIILESNNKIDYRFEKNQQSSKKTSTTNPFINITQLKTSNDNNFYKYTLITFLILILVITLINYRKKIIQILLFNYLTLKRNISKIAIISGFIIFILLITNPSRSDFASHEHWTGDRYLGREKNYFILSIYSNKYHNTRYIGILGNFYLIEKDR